MLNRPPLRGDLYLALDGTAYRCREYRAGDASLTGRIRESYTVLLPDGSSTNAYNLPADAVLVWTAEKPSVTKWVHAWNEDEECDDPREGDEFCGHGNNRREVYR